MDKRRRDSNSPSSKSGREKRARETSPAVAAPVEKRRQHVSPIRTEASSDVFQALKSSCKWLHFLGPGIPRDNEHPVYDILGWKNFVDAMANDINEGNSDMYDGHLNLFIACARVFRCSPIALLSPLLGLCYDVPTVDKTSVDGTTSLWSQTPIRLLTQILTHPVMRGNKDHLATILQYAVILRTDDRRPWIMALQHPTPGGTLADLQKRIKTTKTVDGILTRSGNVCIVRPHVVSRTTIERPTTPENGTRKQLDVPLYHVTAADIENVNCAINNAELNGIYTLPTTDKCYGLFLENTEESDDELDFDQLADFYRRAWHSEFQRIDESIWDSIKVEVQLTQID
ncbi:uncharacterized protein FMAN_11112 [Fusarium mangiferae]|uniref:Uncharacterized protein n=1 Tax=Fusarium mangiferae TaxID=192010 RepID=A0A1L7TKV7_FUSMA|nr:uncharacterized protein FMAN_11112 [Fusarium mangiferae]CVK96783.1 uncharacterized protein FMAN_11112 [Fusarium mangiferae]